MEKSKRIQKHKVFNEALCRSAKAHLPDLNDDDAKDFEVAHGENVITDAVIRYGDRPFSLEFHHVSENQCGAAGMASYKMDKLRTYSWHHQLIAR